MLIKKDLIEKYHVYSSDYNEREFIHKYKGYPYQVIDLLMDFDTPKAVRDMLRIKGISLDIPGKWVDDHHVMNGYGRTFTSVVNLKK